MILIMALLVLAVIGGLHFLGYKLGKRLSRGHRLERWCGLIGILVVFSIFFGDHVVKYAWFTGLCAIVAEEEIYDEIKYNQYLKNPWPARAIVKKGDFDSMKEKYKNFENIENAVNAGFGGGEKFLAFSYVCPAGLIRAECRRIYSLESRMPVSYSRGIRSKIGGWFCEIFKPLGANCFKSC